MPQDTDPEDVPIDARTIPLDDGDDTVVIAQQNAGGRNQVEVDRTGDGDDEERAVDQAAREQEHLRDD